MFTSFRTVLLLIAVLLMSASVLQAQQLPKKTHNHEIPLDSAKKFIHNLKKDAAQLKTNGGLFYRDVFDKMLAQKGVVGLRFYFAKMDDGSPTLVAVGVDSTGKDMTKGTVAEAIYPCPPYCDASSELVK
jgi:hypothetical protein